METASSRIRVVLGLAVAATVAGAASAATAPPDRRPPTQPTIAGQAEQTTSRPVFTFRAADRRTPRGKIRFRCAYDGAALRPCARVHRPATALAFGSHVLRVRRSTSPET